MTISVKRTRGTDQWLHILSQEDAIPRQLSTDFYSTIVVIMTQRHDMKDCTLMWAVKTREVSCVDRSIARRASGIDASAVQGSYSTE